MLRKFCHETGRDWNKGLPFVLFAIRDAKQEYQGFSPAELVFGHNVRGPLKVLQEQLLCSTSSKTTAADYVLRCRERLQRAVRLAQESMAMSQWKMKERFNRRKRTVARQLLPGDSVLKLQPSPSAALIARSSGPT